MNYTTLINMTAQQFVEYQIDEIPTKKLKSQFTIDVFLNRSESALKDYIYDLKNTLTFFTYKQICSICKLLKLKTGRSRKSKEEILINFFSDAATSNIALWIANYNRIQEAIEHSNPFKQMLDEMAIYEEWNIN